MEVVEVWVPAISLPAVFTAILVASEHSNGIQRVGLAVVVANPCSTPESPETSVSYPAPGNTSKMGMEDEGVDESRKQRREKKEKYVQVQSVRGRKRKRKK